MKKSKRDVTGPARQKDEKGNGDLDEKEKAHDTFWNESGSW